MVCVGRSKQPALHACCRREVYSMHGTLSSSLLPPASGNLFSLRLTFHVLLWSPHAHVLPAAKAFWSWRGGRVQRGWSATICFMRVRGGGMLLTRVSRYIFLYRRTSLPSGYLTAYEPLSLAVFWVGPGH